VITFYKMEEDVAVTGGGWVPARRRNPGRLERCRQSFHGGAETASWELPTELSAMLPGAGARFSSRWSVWRQAAQDGQCQAGCWTIGPRQK